MKTESKEQDVEVNFFNINDTLLVWDDEHFVWDDEHFVWDDIFWE